MRSKRPSTRWLTLADPIHGIIQLDRHDKDHRMLVEVMSTRAFQRLRRIRQMGMAEFVFPSALHNRFSHSLGATHLMIQALDHFERESYGRQVLDSVYEDTGISIRTLLLLGILVHDIGHTPLSHTLEYLIGLTEQGLTHDYYWRSKIISEDEELLAIWDKTYPNIPDALERFLGKEGKRRHFLATLVASQLDMDRLDYLLRDSHFLGVKYGQIEEDRIISCLQIAFLNNGEPVVAIREEALPALEHYLFGRHQAYKMALHPLDKASEALLKLLLMRFRWAREQGIDVGDPAEELFQLMTNGQNLSTASYLRMDDNYLWDKIHVWSLSSQDPVHCSLATRMMKHDLLKFIDLKKFGIERPLSEITEVFNKLKHHYRERGLSIEFGYDEMWVTSRPLYTKPPKRDPIWVNTAGQGAVDLSELSTLPLVAQSDKGGKNLAFVWDAKAKNYLIRQLEKYKQHCGVAVEDSVFEAVAEEEAEGDGDLSF